LTGFSASPDTVGWAKERSDVPNVEHRWTYTALPQLRNL